MLIRSNTQLSETRAMALAGAFSGFCNSVVAGPVELFKTKLQVQDGAAYYKSYTDIAQKLYAVSGVRGWFQGTYATMLRDTISIGAQFWAYECVLEAINARYDTGDDESKKAWPFLVAGSAAGIACWVSSYPVDVAKSRIQARILEAPLTARLDGSIRAELRHVYGKYGARGLFAGIVPIMGRAALANAAGFWTWETAKSYVKNDN